MRLDPSEFARESPRGHHNRFLSAGFGIYLSILKHELEEHLNLPAAVEVAMVDDAVVAVAVVVVTLVVIAVVDVAVSETLGALTLVAVTVVVMAVALADERTGTAGASAPATTSCEVIC